MKKVFIDTNVLIDYLAKRTPFYEEAKRIFLLCKEGKVELYISALSFTTIYYVLRKQYASSEQLLSLLKDLRLLVHVASTNDDVIGLALNSTFSDFEDAVQHYTAKSVHVQCIVTRNVKDYKEAEMPVFTPNEFLQFSM